MTIMDLLKKLVLVSKRFLPENMQFVQQHVKYEVIRISNWFPQLTENFAFVCGILIVILIPYLHIGVIYQLWSHYDRKVNQSTCTCSCWDTSFKAMYETGISSYKHVYINATANSFKIWIITVIAICLLSNCIQKIILLYISRKLRMNFCMLFLLNIYPLYYSWWMYFNYWNDSYYKQWSHQMMFTVTELISVVMSIKLTNVNEPVLPWKLLVILNIGITHVFLSLADQFMYNVLRGQGELHQLLRDLGFMIPDLLHIYIPLREFKVLGRRQRMPPTFLVSNRAFVLSVSFVIGIWIFTVVFLK